MSRTTGMKGSDVYTADGLGNHMVALSVLLVRKVTTETVDTQLKKILDTDLDNKSLQDLMVLAFQNRMPRGGKGERDVFRVLYSLLLLNDKTRFLALDLMDLIPEYGYWKDLFKLYPLSHEDSDRSRIRDIVRSQFYNDEQALEGWNNRVQGTEVPKPKVSLLAKWLPREGHALATEMACLLVPGSMLYATKMKHYRKKIARVNKYLDTVEVKMCGEAWSSIDPSIVPGRASKKYSKAFLNQTLRNPKVLRHPDDPDRMDCRQHFIEYNEKTKTGEVKAKGADTVFPHEIIKMVEMGANCESCNAYDECSCKAYLPERNQLLGVWRAMVEAAKAGGGLGRSLAMCDFSGSMANSGLNKDLPYWVSMAMGLLISEVTTDEFKNMFLTFDSTPIIHKLPSGDLFDRVFLLTFRRQWILFFNNVRRRG